MAARRFVLLLCGVACSSTPDGSPKMDGGTGDDTGAGGDAPMMIDSGPPPRTISTWLGTNMDVDLPRVDIGFQLHPFSGTTDANGYPAAGTSGTSSTDIGFVLPTGSYKASYQGDGQLDVSGIGHLQAPWQKVGSEWRGVIDITSTPGQFGNFLTLGVKNGPNQRVTDIHVYMPGVDWDPKDVFLAEFLRVLAPFRAMRFMGWMNTNGSTLADWANRPTSARFGHSDAGEPYEHIAAIVSKTGKDAWINIPEHATDDFVTHLADFLRDTIDWNAAFAARWAQGNVTPFRLWVELSNETWNGGFTAYGTFLAAANANPSRYDGKYTGSYAPTWMAQNSGLMKVGQYEGDRLVQVARIFKKEFGPKSSMIAPVLAGWALGACYSDVALRFIKDNYGDPKQEIAAVAIAPYFDADDMTTGSLPTLFDALAKSIDGTDATFKDFAKLVQEWGIEMTAYEGGQGLAGTTNQPIKHLAQHDQRMYDTYVHYFDFWKKHFGEALFMHFDLAGIAGLPENIYQYGYWGSIITVLEDPNVCSPNLPTLIGNEMIASVVHHCPKYRALREQAP